MTSRFALLQRSFIPLLFLLMIALAGPALAAPDQPVRLSPEVAADIVSAKTGPLARVGPHLAALSSEYQAHLARVAAGATTLAAFRPDNALLPIVGDTVVIDAFAVDDDPLALRAELEQLGASDLAVAGKLVSGRLPIAAIEQLAALPRLAAARPAFSTAFVGRVTSQGDQALRADSARSSFDVDGSGVTVGTLSDSYNCLGGAPAGVAGGDLPQGVQVLEEYTGDDCIDEGRAMMEIIRDLAPGAAQQFHTAQNGQAGFAQGIRDLAAAGSDIIVDDIIYFAEPMFQDGPIAQAADEVVAGGAAYFSAAGNYARNSYESAFRPASQVTLAPTLIYTPHDFDPGPGVDIYQRLTIPAGQSLIASIQWDVPFKSVSGGAGSPSDLDLIVFNSANTAILNASQLGDNLGEDPVDIAIVNASGVSRSVNIFIGNYETDGDLPEPGYLKVVYFADISFGEFDTASGTLFGHANAARAIAVGAADYNDTPAFGVTPPRLRDFSAGGGTPILFEVNGTRKGAPEVRPKPEITSVDGANTTFFTSGFDPEDDGFPNFPGTSAAAPHAAAVAALLREADASLTPANILDLLQDTAIDMGPAGFDNDSGAGLIQADAALGNLRSTADLALSLSAEPYTAPGRPLTYTLSLNNRGPDLAREVVLTDTLPAGVNFVGATATQGSCSRSGARVTCTIGSLAASATAGATIRVTTGSGASGSLFNSATITTSDNDPVLSNNTVSTTTQVVPISATADLQLTAGASAAQLDVSRPLTYTVTVENRGPSTASNLTATIKLPASAVYRTASGSGWSCGRSGVTVTCTRASLASNASAPITIGVTTSAQPGELILEASITATTPDLNSLTNQVVVRVRTGRTYFLPMMRT